MTCKMVCSKSFSRSSDEEWIDTIKKMPRLTTSLEEWPTEEEQIATRIDFGDVKAWRLVDGSILIYITTESCDQVSNPNQGYFVLSNLENVSKETLLAAIAEMEQGRIDKWSRKACTIYNSSIKNNKYGVEDIRKIVCQHINALRKALENKANIILRIITKGETKCN